MPFYMPRPTLVSWILGRQMDICKFDNYLEAAVCVALSEIHPTLGLFGGFECTWLRLNNLASGFYPCFPTLIIIIFIFAILLLWAFIFW